MSLRNVILGIVLGMFLTACSQVDNGERGLYIKWGETQDEILSEGLYFYNPISTDIKKLDAKEIVSNYSLIALSNDIQEITLDIAITWSIDKQKVNKLYKEYGEDYANKILIPALNATIKETIGKYSAVDVVTKREVIMDDIYKKLQIILQNRYLVLTKFDITNINFKSEFKNAIEEKVIAIQQAEKAKNDTIRIQEESNQKLIQAKSEAEAMRIKSQALSQNKNLVEYEAVLKWDGKLPQYMMGNSVPFVKIQN